MNITPIGCFGECSSHPTFTLSASPIYSSKEVQVFFGLVRTRVVVAHPKHFFKFALPIFVGFLAILVGQSTVAPPANASIFGSGYNAPYAGGGGGNQNGTNACPAID